MGISQSTEFPKKLLKPQQSSGEQKNERLLAGEHLDIPQVLENLPGGTRADSQKPKQETESDQESSENSSSSDRSFEMAIKQCFRNLNCESEISSAFVMEIEKNKNNKVKCSGDELLCGFLDECIQFSDVPDSSLFDNFRRVD